MYCIIIIIIVITIIIGLKSASFIAETYAVLN